MPRIKPHLSVEQIAKKHRVDVSFIEVQLKMGEKIEHEHTKNHSLAKDIALQHLSEIPDYYTRLIKMERSSKKPKKSTKTVTEEKKMKGKDPCWKGYEMVGTKLKKGKEVPNCVPKEEYESVDEGKKGLWANIHARRKKGLPPKKPGQEGYPETLNIKEGIKKARKNVGASKCWTGKKLGNPPTKMKGGKEVPNCVSEESSVRYCPKCGKEETGSECKYGERYWDMFSIPISLGKKYNPNSPHPANEEKDHEYSMARSELSKISNAAKRLQKKIGKGEGNLEAWVQSKITRAADYIDTAADYVDSGEMKKEDVSIEDAHGNLYAEIIDIIKPQPLKASKGLGSKILGEGWEDKLKNMTPDQIENLKKSNPGAAEKIDALTKKAKSATPRPVGSGSQLPSVPKSTKPTVNTTSRPKNNIDSLRRQGVSIARAAQAKRAAKSAAKPSVLKTLSKVKNPKVAIPLAIAGGIYGLITSPKRKNRKEEYSNWRLELGLSEDWQSVNRKDKTDGLSQKAVNAYRRENPGSKLQTAVTEKNPTGKRADRRSNFCSRMSGMKDKLTSEKTARDPDSRINKALRRWNCN